MVQNLRRLRVIYTFWSKVYAGGLWRLRTVTLQDGKACVEKNERNLRTLCRRKHYRECGEYSV